MIIAHLNIFPKLIYHAAIIKQVLEFQFYMIVDHLKICSGPKLQVVLQMPFWFPRRPKEQKVGMYIKYAIIIIISNKKSSIVIKSRFVLIAEQCLVPSVLCPGNLRSRHSQ